MNEMENEVAENISLEVTETYSNEETKQETLDTKDKKDEHQSPKKHTKGLTELLDEFEN